MAVPKKRTSKSKKLVRKFHWKRKAILQTNKVFSLPSLRLNTRKLKNIQ